MNDIHPYATLDYAQSLAHVGLPFEVPQWGTYVIAREIPGGGIDAVGCYPIAVLNEEADLLGGLRRLRDAGFVSVTLVLDDWHRPPISMLESVFDVCRPFKTHHFVHKGHSSSFEGRYVPHKNHRHKIAKAQRAVFCGKIDLAEHMDAWCSMYTALVLRHGMSGAHAFPREAFERQAAIPGMVAIGGFVGGELVCVNSWAVFDGRAHSHLVASNSKGYETQAAYAVTDHAIRHFAECDVINLGGGAGTDDSNNGLAQFKAGFSNARSQGWICGAILDQPTYNAMTRAGADASFFPAYRMPVREKEAA